MSDTTTTKHRAIDTHIGQIAAHIAGLPGKSTCASNAELAGALHLSLRTFTRALAAGDGTAFNVGYHKSSGRGSVARTITVPSSDGANEQAVEVAQ